MLTEWQISYLSRFFSLEIIGKLSEVLVEVSISRPLNNSERLFLLINGVPLFSILRLFLVSFLIFCLEECCTHFSSLVIGKSCHCAGVCVARQGREEKHWFEKRNKSHHLLGTVWEVVYYQELLYVLKS